MRKYSPIESKIVNTTEGTCGETFYAMEVGDKTIIFSVPDFMGIMSDGDIPIKFLDSPPHQSPLCSFRIVCLEPKKIGRNTTLPPITKEQVEINEMIRRATDILSVLRDMLHAINDVKSRRPRETFGIPDKSVNEAVDMARHQISETLSKMVTTRPPTACQVPINAGYPPRLP